MLLAPVSTCAYGTAHLTDVAPLGAAKVQQVLNVIRLKLSGPRGTFRTCPKMHLQRGCWIVFSPKLGPTMPNLGTYHQNSSDKFTLDSSIFPYRQRCDHSHLAR